MTQRKYVRFLLLPVVAMAVACGKSIPDDIIQPVDMENLLYDYHLAITMGNDLSYSEKYKRESYKEYVLKKHGVTKAEFDSSMVWYTRNGVELTNIYKNLQKRYEMAEEQIRAEVNKRSGQIEVSLSGDSIDLWSDRNLYWLTSSPLTNRLEFDLKADTSFHQNDALVLVADYNFMSSVKKNTSKAVVAMNIVFKNDSTQGISATFKTSGSHELYLRADSAYNFKSVTGFVYFSNPDSLDASLLISNIRLMRYRNGSYSSKPIAKNVISVSPEKNVSSDVKEADINKEEKIRVSDRKVRPVSR